jgi:hypothetical protein
LTGEILKIKEHYRQPMPLIQAVQRLMKGGGLTHIRSIGAGLIEVSECIHHLVERNLHLTVSLAARLRVAMSEYPNQPTLHRLYIAQTGPRPIGLEERFLG